MRRILKIGVFIVLILVLFCYTFILIKKSIHLKIENSEDILSIKNMNEEHFENNLELYNEAISIIKNDFVSPLGEDQILIMVNNEYGGFGYIVDPFINKIVFSDDGYFLCEYDSVIYSMCNGIVKDIYVDCRSVNFIIIEYSKDLEIYYIGITENDIKIRDSIMKGQLLGIKKHMYMRGGGDIMGKDYFLMRIKYKGVFLNPYILLKNAPFDTTYL